MHAAYLHTLAPSHTLSMRAYLNIIYSEIKRERERGKELKETTMVMTGRDVRD
jgi:hypothetical protein